MGVPAPRSVDEAAPSVGVSPARGVPLPRRGPEAAPPCAAAQARWVELEGDVQPLTELAAPLSGAACVLYRVTLTLRQRFWEGLGAGAIRETAGGWFLVWCTGGPVLVDPERAVLRLRGGGRCRVRLGRDHVADGRVRELYARLARGAPGTAVAGLEQRLHGAERVLAGGWLDSHPDPRGAPAGYREPPRLPLLHAAVLRTLRRR